MTTLTITAKGQVTLKQELLNISVSFRAKELRLTSCQMAGSWYEPPYRVVALLTSLAACQNGVDGS